MGTVGNSAKGLLREILEASGCGRRWRTVEVDPCNAVGVQPVAVRKAARAIELFRALFRAREVDVLACMFVDNRSRFWISFAHRLGKKAALFWLGSDVDNLTHGRLSPRGLDKADIHFAHSEGNVKELARFGLRAECMVMPTRLSKGVAKMPDHHSVLLSIPDSRREFYGYRDLMRLVDDYPDVEFHVVRSETPDFYRRPNIVFEGMLDRDQMDELFNRVSISVRWPEHDGTSFVLIESAFKGKYIISKNYFPCGIVTNTYEGLCEAMDLVLGLPLEPCMENREYALANFTQEEAGRRYVHHLDGLFG